MTTWFNPYAGSGGHSSTTSTTTPINPPLVFSQTGTAVATISSMGNLTITAPSSGQVLQMGLWGSAQQAQNYQNAAAQQAYQNNAYQAGLAGQGYAHTPGTFSSGIDGWDYEDVKKAGEEGWGMLSLLAGEEHMVKVIRIPKYVIPDPTTAILSGYQKTWKFESNNMAYLYLMGKAESGSEFHKRALAIAEKYG